MGRRKKTTQAEMIAEQIKYEEEQKILQANEIEIRKKMTEHYNKYRPTENNVLGKHRSWDEWTVWDILKW